MLSEGQIMMEDLKTTDGVKKLNDYLTTRSYITGYQPSQADRILFEKLQKAPQSTYAHALRWYNHIKSFGNERTSFPASITVYKEAETKQEKAQMKNGGGEDDDDLDLFGSDDEVDEEAEKVKQERLKQYADKKSKKPGVIAKSSVVLDVKPWDDETNMQEMEKRVRSIACDGLVWGASKLVPLAFGIHKLQIVCIVEDEKVSIDWLQEEIQNFEDYVQSVDIAAFQKL